MIPVYKKLEQENLLKKPGLLLDLGSGNGRMSLPFFEYGYEVVLVDKDAKTLSLAEDNFKKIKESGFKIINTVVEGFDFKETYDGIIISNVLPFQTNNENVEGIVKKSFESLNKGGFLYFTLFGPMDEWATEHAATMIFHTKDEALSLIKENPYYFSEDYGQGSTMKGDIKTWHIFHLLYIK